MKEMVAETERLILRRYESRDFDDLYEYLSDPEVVEFEPYKAQTAEETRENLLWRISSEAMIAVELKENGKMIGNVYLGDGDFGSKELRYVFNKKFWHKGYAKEACEQSLKNVSEMAFTESLPIATRRIWHHSDCLKDLDSEAKGTSGRTSISGRMKTEIPSGKTALNMLF